MGMSCRGAQHMVRDPQDVERQTYLRKYAEDRAGRPAKKTRDTAIHDMHQDNENTEVATKEFNAGGSKFSPFTKSHQY